MKYDPHVTRFISYLSLFTYFMFMLITANNFILLFFGWEGVGLCSYLLISFWYTRVQANKAALKAFIVNRVSDFIFVLGIIFIFFTFQTTDFAVIFSIAPFVTHKVLTFYTTEIKLLDIASLLIFIGAIGKSAQIGLHT